MKKTLASFGALALVITHGITGVAHANGSDAAPLSVGQDLILDAGHVRAGYVYENTKIFGGSSGTHNFGADFGLFPNLTISGSVQVLDALSFGLGDVAFNGTFNLGNIGNCTFRPAVGFTAPNGFSSLRSVGTWRLNPAFTAFCDDAFGPVGIGAQYAGNVSVNNNPFGFAPGDIHTINGWADIDVHENVELFGIFRADFFGSASGERVIVRTSEVIFVSEPSIFEFVSGGQAVYVGGGANVDLTKQLRVRGEAQINVHDSDGLDRGRTFLLSLEGTF